MVAAINIMKNEVRFGLWNCLRLWVRTLSMPAVCEVAANVFGGLESLAVKVFVFSLNTKCNASNCRYHQTTKPKGLA